MADDKKILSYRIFPFGIDPAEDVEKINKWLQIRNIDADSIVAIREYRTPYNEIEHQMEGLIVYFTEFKGRDNPFPQALSIGFCPLCNFELPQYGSDPYCPKCMAFMAENARVK